MAYERQDHLEIAERAMDQFEGDGIFNSPDYSAAVTDSWCRAASTHALVGLGQQLRRIANALESLDKSDR